MAGADLDGACRLQAANGQAAGGSRYDAQVIYIATSRQQAGQNGVPQDKAAGPAVATQDDAATSRPRAQGSGEDEVLIAFG